MKAKFTFLLLNRSAGGQMGRSFVPVSYWSDSHFLISSFFKLLNILISPTFTHLYFNTQGDAALQKLKKNYRNPQKGKRKFEKEISASDVHSDFHTLAEGKRSRVKTVVGGQKEGVQTQRRCSEQCIYSIYSWHFSWVSSFHNSASN